MKNKRKILIICGILVAIVFAIVYAYTFDSKFDLNGDNANYLNLAKNISHGFGYSSMTPTAMVPASHYPPGYSFFLSLFMLAGIQNLLFFKILNGIFLLTSLLMLGYMVWKLTDNAFLGLIISLIPIFSPHLQHFANIVMSEMLYLFCTVLSLFALYKYQQKKETVCFWRLPWFYVAVVSAVASYYIRTVGTACLFALIVFFLFRKEWKQALASIIGIVLLVLPWSLRNNYYGIESRYLGTIMTVNPWRPEQGTISSVGEMVEKMIKNFDETVIKGFKEGLFPFLQIDYQQTSSIGGIIAGFIVLAVVFYGAWRILKLRWWLISYLIANIGLFMLWHGGNGLRYVVPILPIVYLCFYMGVYAIFELIFNKIGKKQYVRKVPFAFLLVIFLMLPAVKQQAAVARMPYPKAFQNYFTIAEKINNDKFRASVVCCRKPELFTVRAPYVYAVNYLYTKDSYMLIKDLINKRVDYVVLEQLGYSSTGLYLYPAIMDYAELFSVEIQLRNPDTFLLKFDRARAAEKIKEYEWKYVE